MTALTIRPARSDRDHESVARVAYAAYGATGPFELYAGVRLRHPFIRTATAWLAEHEGDVVASLRAYPLELDDGTGRVLPGVGLGSVGTLPAQRKRGFASALCRRVLEANDADGRRVGLLFTRVPPSVYARFGFAVVDAWGWRCEAPGEISGERAEVRAVDPVRDADLLLKAYHAANAGRLHLRRDATSWLGHLAHGTRDVFLRLSGAAEGYLRLFLGDGALDVLEMQLLPGSDRPSALRAAARLAAEANAALVGWFPPGDFVDAHFTPTSRAESLPMVRGCDALDGARFWGIDYF